MWSDMEQCGVVWSGVEWWSGVVWSGGVEWCIAGYGGGASGGKL